MASVVSAGLAAGARVAILSGTLEPRETCRAVPFALSPGLLLAAPTSVSMPRPDSSVVERGPEKAGVGGSIPSLATTLESSSCGNVLETARDLQESVSLGERKTLRQACSAPRPRPSPSIPVTPRTAPRKVTPTGSGAAAPSTSTYFGTERTRRSRRRPVRGRRQNGKRRRSGIAGTRSSRSFESWES